MSADVLHSYRMQVARGVRRLAVDDTEQVTELLEQLGYPQGETNVAERLQRWVEHPDGASFVWDERGRLLGVIAAHVIPSFEKDGAWLRIVALAVSESARGRGIGTSLVAAAETFGLMRGCSSVEVTSMRTREGAHAFYRALGYHDRSDAAGRFLRQLP
ncbi:GNAT family N-acetyltransferase [Dactylosporangium sp. AC04546]|uniref:GNAT family N-acetyltransferase n=1 Tax=Dactylosporangium sp. AC04546 TaxID=2862460 RepID=UPI001EDF13D1|nr:GNAT family N-acetyltransferase [Dactylosporangium sp. AC04546]WVK84950.1 GNAT family N-acetyltransferase [Dactylosporangium sp. AC04546]